METRVPERVRAVLSAIENDRTLNPGVKAMADRANEFDSPLAARLAGVAVHGAARAEFDGVLDEYWRSGKAPAKADEVIVGGGLHAAVYAAVRVAQGHPKPIVIEASERVGGVFASSRAATFYLNSRNRAGAPGMPGRGESLNYVPGAVVQPAALSGDEYQTNDALAFSIRTTLLMNSKVVSGRRVVGSDATSVTLDDGRTIRTPRVIWAPGLGEAKAPDVADGEHLMTYPQFLASLDKPFPFRGIRRVAVVGAGDSGKTAIEALIGQGPRMGMTSVALDAIERIDWYGVPERCVGGREAWETNNRSRYKGIGRDFRRPGQIPGRVLPLVERAQETAIGYDGAYVNGNRYDLVIWATGFKAAIEGVTGMAEYKVGGRAVARMIEGGNFAVGPAASLPLGNYESQTVPENSAAVFRYADRTATFAMHLPRLGLPTDGAVSEPDRSRYGYGVGDVIQLSGDEATVLKIDGNRVSVRELDGDGDPILRDLGSPQSWTRV